MTVIARQLDEEGYVRLPTMKGEATAEIAALFDATPEDRPGIRMDPDVVSDLRAIRSCLASVRDIRRRDMRVVRVLLFDKHGGSNWSLGWHQDRTIEVAEERSVPGFGPYTRKHGRLHVAPPIAITAAMLTVRFHVDAVDVDNAPLIVAPGSHREGYVPEHRIADIVAHRGEAACLAPAGGVWLYATPILHRSDRAVACRRRRVLQVDLAAGPLPGGLHWAGDATS